MSHLEDDQSPETVENPKISLSEEATSQDQTAASVETPTSPTDDDDEVTCEGYDEFTSILQSHIKSVQDAHDVQRQNHEILMDKLSKLNAHKRKCSKISGEADSMVSDILQQLETARKGIETSTESAKKLLKR